MDRNRVLLLSVLVLLFSQLARSTAQDTSSLHHHKHGENHRHHNCVHSELVEPEIERMMNKIKSIPWETHRSVNVRDSAAKSRKLLSELDEPKPFRVKVDYQLDNLTPEQETFLKEKLVPAMIGVFKRSLSVRRPVKGPLKLPHLCSTLFRNYPEYCVEVINTCGSAVHNPKYMGDWRTCTAPYDSECTTHKGGEGAEGADFVLYITSIYEEACLPPYDAVASGGFCLLDTDNWYGLPNRPLAGVANLCPNHLSTADEDFGFMLDTLVHEVMHATLMSRALMDEYTDKSGKKRKETVAIENGKAKVITPAVQKHVQNMFDCETLDGANLEDEGGSGTAGSHWESRMFMGELMVGKSSASSRDTLSNVTLALAEDSGWYAPNYGNAGVLVASHKKGCDYATSSCLREAPSLRGVFCWDSRPVGKQPNICTSDHMAIGYCRNGLQLMGGCSLVTRFSNTACTVPDDKSKGIVDMGTRLQAGARCFPIASNILQRAADGYVSYSAIEAACFATKCRKGKLYFEIPESTQHEAMEFACPEGKFVDLTKAGIGYSDGLVGPCPPAKSICMWHGCPGDCYGNGQCVEGTCKCHIGFVGEACAHQACVKNSCAGGYKCNWLLGRCVSNDTPTSQKSVPEVTTQGDFREIQPTGPSSTETHTSSHTETVVPGADPVTVSGKAVWNGYLAGCAIFGDINGDRKWNQGEPGALTSPNGDWKFQMSDNAQIVLDPTSRSTCRDIFTGLQPKWSIQAPCGSNFISPLTTLAVVTRRTAIVALTTNEAFDNPDAGQTLDGASASTSQVKLSNHQLNDNRLSDSTLRSHGDELWIDPEFLSGLMLDHEQLVERDIIHAVLVSRDQSSEKVLVLSTVLANTVTQVSALVAGTLTNMDETAAHVLQIIGESLSQQSFDMQTLAREEVILKIVKEAQAKKNIASAARAAVSKTIASLNQVAFDAGENNHFIAIVEYLTRLSHRAQGNYSRLAALLAQQKIDENEYTNLTRLEALELEDVDVFQIKRVMGIETSPEETQELFSVLDFEKSELSLFIAVLLLLSLLVGTCWCCHSRVQPSATTVNLEPGTVIVDPMVGAVHTNPLNSH